MHKPKIVEALAVSGAYDMVIYGHTHKAEIEKKEDKALMISPGECRGRLTRRRTVAIHDLEKDEAKIEQV
jgi:putative phosphoesterase